MEPTPHFDVSYIPSAPPNTFQTFDIYVPKSILDTSTLVCFVHGGAWRTRAKLIREDKADHATLGRMLALSTGYPVALPNYRLTPRHPTPDDSLHHPAHAQDLLRFLEFMLSWHEENGGCLPRKPTRLFLIGHSCSAHMLSTIFLHMPRNSDSVCPSDELVQSTAAIIMSEGIYDIDLLLSSFPGYGALFIENTFGRRESYEYVSAVKATMDPRGQHIRWFVIHSKGDTLVDERQSQGMYDFLKDRSCVVSKSFHELDDEHDAILQSPKYIEMIKRYIGVLWVRTNIEPSNKCTASL